MPKPSLPVKHLLMLMSVLALAACGPAGLPVTAKAVGEPSAPVRAQSLTGDIRHHPAIGSRFLAQKRDVWVYLPPGYAERPASRRYPVLYMHDGNNVFDGSAAFGGHEWGADETAEKLIRAGELPPIILVAVSNSPDRLAEYTWVSGLLGGKREGGQGQAYARFLVEELKPMIDRRYATERGRAHTGVIGSSLGGLISLYLGSHHGDTFGKIGLMSPSIWWADRAALGEAARLPRKAKVWLDFGHKEGSNPQEGLENARELKRRLLERGWRENGDLGYFEDQQGGHDERAWAYRLPMALKFLYGKAKTASP